MPVWAKNIGHAKIYSCQVKLKAQGMFLGLGSFIHLHYHNHTATKQQYFNFVVVAIMQSANGEC